MSMTVGGLAGAIALFLIVYAILTLYLRIILGMHDDIDDWIREHKKHYCGLTFAFTMLMALIILNKDVVLW